MDGAAIYATSIGRCIYTPTSVTGANSTNYENSIFQVSPPFEFSGNRLSTSTEKKVATLATAPSNLIVTPQVGTDLAYIANGNHCENLQYSRYPQLVNVLVVKSERLQE